MFNLKNTFFRIQHSAVGPYLQGAVVSAAELAEKGIQHEELVALGAIAPHDPVAAAAEAHAAALASKPADVKAVEDRLTSVEGIVAKLDELFGNQSPSVTPEAFAAMESRLAAAEAQAAALASLEARVKALEEVPAKPGK
jgi:hypothetical protein